MKKVFVASTPSGVVELLVKNLDSIDGKIYMPWPLRATHEGPEEWYAWAEIKRKSKKNK